jgi:uncharacterized protein
MKALSPLFAGLLFGLGLCLSGMTDPAKVLGFLDLAGRWDPSLALVMAAALAVAAPAFFVARRRRLTLAGEAITLPATSPVDARLIGGSALFGIGWGLVGLCPGPALANIGFASGAALVFVLGMAAGIRLHDALAGGAPVLAESAGDA